MSFCIYLIFIVSFFLHLPERIPILGSIRFDLVLIITTAASLFMFKDSHRRGVLDKAGVILLALMIYIVLSLPFVQWPGSVINYGFENYFKVIIFYFFTVMIVTDERKLRVFLLVFVACQVFRVLEPLYLHLTIGYWGDNTFLGDGEMMNRLAGSQYDVINPNGLAYVAVTAISFLYYLCQSVPNMLKLVGYSLLPVIAYALVLTSSRSGMLALAGVAVAMVTASKRKIVLFGVITILAIIAYQSLGQVQQERYLSIYRDDVRGASTAQGRIDGIYRDFEVAMNRPLFGHGLGTSLEANYNIGRSVFRSHNLFMEVWQEIGLVGLFIFFFLILTGIRNYFTALKNIKLSGNSQMLSLARGIGAWLVLNLIYCIFSYGLSTYSWYLFVGLSVVLLRLSVDHGTETRKGAVPA
jgi:putative inorganic carbon (HCO3(-)) transporter